jgi:threonine dehydrogenase-like Zn-dependent dehydrogenase
VIALAERLSQTSSSTANMGAAVLAAPGKLEIRRVIRPAPGVDQVLVRLQGCGVCASNIPPWEGRPWFDYPMPPGALGHEGWGVVEEIGPNVTQFARGDRVGLISNNAYAEFDLGASGSIVRLPDQLRHQPFPAEPLGCATNIFRRSAIRPDDTVAVVGIGFLGALLTQLATAAGARVIAITRRAFALPFATAEYKITLDEHQRVIERVKQITAGKLCDVVIECTGKQEPLDLSAELTRERGRLVVAGYHQDGLRQVNMQMWNWRGLDVINAHERDPAVYLRGMQEAVGAVIAGKLNPAPLYTHHFSLDQIGAALRMTAERPDGFMKALIHYDR